MRPRPSSVLCALGLALSLTGCFVLEELDRGSELMDKHSTKANAAKQAAEKEAAVPAKKDSLASYFREEASAGTTKTFTPGSVSEGIVACKLGGSTQFMKKEDCGARGGRY